MCHANCWAPAMISSALLLVPCEIDFFTWRFLIWNRTNLTFIGQHNHMNIRMHTTLTILKGADSMSACTILKIDHYCGVYSNDDIYFNCSNYCEQQSSRNAAIVCDSNFLHDTWEWTPSKNGTLYYIRWLAWTIFLMASKIRSMTLWLTLPAQHIRCHIRHVCIVAHEGLHCMRMMRFIDINLIQSWQLLYILHHSFYQINFVDSGADIKLYWL